MIKKRRKRRRRRKKKEQQQDSNQADLKYTMTTVKKTTMRMVMMATTGSQISLKDCAGVAVAVPSRQETLMMIDHLYSRVSVMFHMEPCRSGER